MPSNVPNVVCVQEWGRRRVHVQRGVPLAHTVLTRDHPAPSQTYITSHPSRHLFTRSGQVRVRGCTHMGGACCQAMQTCACTAAVRRPEQRPHRRCKCTYLLESGAHRHCQRMGDLGWHNPHTTLLFFLPRTRPPPPPPKVRGAGRLQLSGVNLKARAYATMRGGGCISPYGTLTQALVTKLLLCNLRWVVIHEQLHLLKEAEHHRVHPIV